MSTETHVLCACSRAILRAVALTKLEDVDGADTSQHVKQVSIDNCNIGIFLNILAWFLVLFIPLLSHFSHEQVPLIQTRSIHQTLGAHTSWISRTSTVVCARCSASRHTHWQVPASACPEPRSARISKEGHDPCQQRYARRRQVQRTHW